MEFFLDMKSTHSLTTNNNYSPEKSGRNESPDFGHGKVTVMKRNSLLN